MAYTLFDLHPGDKFQDMDIDKSKNKFNMVSRRVRSTYAETARFPISRDMGFNMLKSVNCFSAQFSESYVISFDGSYIGGDLADDYVVHQIITVWRNDENNDEWFISIFSLQLHFSS